jgi:hypothetical protein
MMLTFLLISSFAYKGQVQSFFDKKFKLKEQEIYFNALVKSTIPTKSLQYKMMNLPGVIKVKIIPSKNLKSKLKKSLDNVDVNLASEMANLDYQVLKISLAKNVNAKSLSLIKEYLVRVIGQDSLTLSSLKRKNGVDQNNSFLVGFLKKISLIFCLVFSIMWFSSFFSTSMAIENEAYLVEKFQRRSNVKIKVFLFFEFIALFPLLLVSAVDTNVELLNILFAFLPLGLMHLTLVKNVKWRDNR